MINKEKKKKKERNENLQKWIINKWNEEKNRQKMNDENERKKKNGQKWIRKIENKMCTITEL